jgi:predicted ATPase/DNA-binding CsgD family transcriptional regulator
MMRPVSTIDASSHHIHRRLGTVSNLSAELSSFVGRDADLARTDHLLAGTRLLTLVGAGGCGKTRLGRQLAMRAAARFPDGVWWVELAALTDGALAADALARVLDLPVEGVPAMDVLIEHLAEASALVVFDNCEHLSDAVADVVAALLRGTSGLCVLATSRQRLDVEGETTWRVPSMAVPPPGTAWSDLGDFDAARLFLERLAQARPDGLRDADAADAVVQICGRLDGIPLALELAAARARTMTLSRIVAELDDRFRLLTGGPRQALARHQTLRASVQWSYKMLVEPERTLLRRLSVFVGGFRAEGAEAVAGFAPLSARDVLDLLTQLVDRSLVQFDAATGRYRLLETLRQYGREQLDEHDETVTVADRHLGWSYALAEGADPAMTRADLDALDAMEAELPNLRVALDHAVDGPADLGLRLIAALTFFWSQRGLGMEGADRAARVLVAHPQAPGHLRARAFAASAYDRFYGGDFDGAVSDADRGLAEAVATGDDRAHARSRHAHGMVAFLADPPLCRTAMAEAIVLATRSGDRWCETDALQVWSFSHLIQHRPGIAQEAMLRSAAMAEEEGNAFQLACHQLGLGMTAAAGARLVESADAARRGADEAQRIGDPVIELWGRAQQATSALTLGRVAHIDEVADQIEQTGRPLVPVVEMATGLLRRIAKSIDRPEDIAGLLELGELLRSTFVPNEGLRLILIGISGALAHGDDEHALELATVTLARAEAFGSALTGPCRVLLGRLRRRVGAPAEADRMIHAGLVEIVDAGLLVDLPDALEALGGTALDLGSTAEAARLLGAAAGLRSRLDVPGPYPSPAASDLARLADLLGGEFAARFAEGEHLDAEAAVAYARRAHGERKRPPFGWEALTPTELQVARLAAEGLTNPAIGERLFVTRGTVKTHLEHIYAKLSLRNRSELAAAAARRFADANEAG